RFCVAVNDAVSCALSRQCSKYAVSWRAASVSGWARFASSPTVPSDGLLCGYSKLAFQAVSILSPEYSWLPGAAMTFVVAAEALMPVNQLRHSVSLEPVLIRSPACTEPIERGAFASACFTTEGQVVSRPICASP